VNATGEFSEAALSARLGPHLYAACVQAALDAPTPSPEVVERIRLIFAPGVRRLLEQQPPTPRARAA